MTAYLNTINIVINNDLCLVCGFCIPVCPENCITMKFNQIKGYQEPVINFDKCTDCNECLEVCPGWEVDFPKLNALRKGEEPEFHHIGIIRESMILYAADLEIRRKAASGGIVTQLISYLFDNGLISGAMVVKPSRENPFDPVAYIARNFTELVASQMSIYTPVPFGLAINDLKKEKGKVVISGIPCQVHGLLKMAEADANILNKILMIIGTFCGGYQTSFAHQYYFPRQGISFDEMQYIDYRYGDFPGDFNIGLFGGKRFQLKRRFSTKRKANEINAAFNSSFYLPRCYTCPDKANILTDITVGDPWLPKFKGEKDGKSIVVTRTEKGSELIHKAIKDGVLIREEATFDDVMVVQKFDRERHGNQPAYQKVYRLINKQYPKYIYLGKTQLFNRRIYFRVVGDIFKIWLQRHRKLWFLIRPVYFLEKHFRNIFIYSNPFSYILKKLKFCEK